MTGKRIGYVRVSTSDQNPERQLEGVDVDKKFIDYATGTVSKRPELQRMLQYAREDDTIVVHSIDRLARNLRDLRNIVDELIVRRVSVQFIKENLMFSCESSAISNLLLSIIGAVAEFEHSIIRERNAEGIAIAKRAGKYKGRKKILNKEKAEYIKLHLSLGTSKGKIARDIGVCRSSIYKYITELGIK